MQLFTIGYEGIDIDSFVGRLKDNAIDCLLDVREMPFSYKRGFSKSPLAERLERENIRYVHFRELGSPRPVRKELKETGDYLTFFRKIEEYLDGKQPVIEEAYRYVEGYTCCLMCFEHSVSQCHRKIVASKIKERDGNGLLVADI